MYTQTNKLTRQRYPPRNNHDLQNSGGFQPTCKVDGMKSVPVYASSLISALFHELKGWFVDLLLPKASVFASFPINTADSKVQESESVLLNHHGQHCVSSGGSSVEGCIFSLASCILQMQLSSWMPIASCWLKILLCYIAISGTPSTTGSKYISSVIFEVSDGQHCLFNGSQICQVSSQYSCVSSAYC